MIGLDTNVIVRYVMQDDPKQSQKASKFIESLTPEIPGFVPLVAVVELVWVLTSCYDLTREQVAQVLDALLRAKEIVLERAEQVSQALRTFSAGGADFADCLIERTAATAGCEQTMTFDTGAAKFAGMALIG
ncbi:MAG TPA: type II toxin-antitoxin system VapC family toxin [Steroidobacteraceae bacterium]|nr:type II toxin-antitoxin system VapC family toxin [Steroidobacteraceae bacterium]